MKQAWWILAIWLISHQAWSSVTLLEMQTLQTENQLQLDARAQLSLPKIVIEAIQHEIPIHLVTEIQLIREDQFFIFPYTTQQLKQEYTTILSYSRFERRYQLHNLRNGNQSSFRSLESALETFGSLLGFSLIHLNEIYPGVRYQVWLSFRLNFWELPASLLTETLWNSDWRFKSERFTLPLMTGQTK